MEKWRLISLTGIILGIIQHLDYIVEGLSNIVISLLAIILIFAGLIIRRREKNQEQ